MRLIHALCLTMILAACTPLTIYHRPGADVARMQDDQLTCEVSALRDAPVALEIRRTPPVFVPHRSYCDGAGHCVTRRGYWDTGHSYTVDVNADLRGRLQNRCMAQKGYRPVSIPVCPPAVTQAAPPGRTTTLPALSAQSCAIRNRDGTWQIVSRG